MPSAGIACRAVIARGSQLRGSFAGCRAKSGGKPRVCPRFELKDFLDICLFLQLDLVPNVPYLWADAMLGRLDPLGHLDLTQPSVSVVCLSHPERIFLLHPVF